MNILESILESINVENELLDEKDISDYLNKIKNNFKDLREAYRNNFVKINYKDKNNQEAYLLAYYPCYTDLIVDVLEYININHPKLNIPENMCLIGAGPAPEMIGFIKFINNQSKDYENINIELFDIVSEWSYARNILKNIVHNFCLTRLKIHNIKIDFSKKITSSSSLLKRYKSNTYKRIVVFQNIINEIEQKFHEKFIENVLICFKNLVAGSFLIIIDLNYGVARSVTYQIESKLREALIKNFGNSDNYENKPVNRLIPQIIRNNLYDSSENPRKWVTYSYSIFYKQK